MPLRFFLRGNVCLRLSGANVEKIINAAARQGVVLRDVRRLDARTLRCAMSYKEFYALRPALRSLGCRVRIESRFGLAHLRSRLRARAMWPVGALSCLILLLWLTSIVWGVDVLGGEGVDESILHGALARAGVHAGMLRGEVSADAIEAALREAVPDTGFVTVKMQGLRLRVELVRLRPDPVIIDKDTPTDIVAAFDGVIERVIALEGRAVVLPGQKVKKGDVLIEGLALGPNGLFPVRAMGEALGRVEVYGEGSAPMLQEIATSTGNYQNRTLFWLLDYWLPLYDAPPYAHYEIASRETPLLPGLYLPAGVRRETVYEMRIDYHPRAQEEIEREALEKAERDALLSLPKGSAVVDKWVEYDKIKETEVRAVVGLLSIQPIGEEQPRLYEPPEEETD